MTDPTNLVGQTIGRYRILEHLGEGGMAEVYKAYQPSLDRHVAIKVMHAFLARDADFLGRFEREAKSVAALQHPNIIQVHDFDVHNGMPYMVMEFVAGGTLKNHFEKLARANQSPSLAETVRIVREVGRALAYAHQRGMIHRDVKPANVLMGSGGRVILSDFGIAKILSGPSFTMSGTTVGTPSYMSPEQSLGQPGDHRSDIYALGVVLYQLSTGQLPYVADTPMAVMLKQVNEPLPPPRSVRPDLPESLERVILKAMAKNPADRFQTAEEMLAHLDNLETAARLAPVAPAPPAPPAPTSGLRPPEGATMYTASSAPPTGTPPPVAPPKAKGQPWFIALLSVPVLLVLCLVFGAGGLALAAGMGMFNTPEPTAIPTRRPTRTPEPTAVPTGRPTRTPAPTTTAEAQAGVLLEDDFETDANDWPELENDTSRREYRDGQYVLEILDGQWIIWSTPDMDEVSDVNISVTVTNLGGDDATFGLICNYQGNDAFYYLGFGEDGYYAIVRVEGDEDVFLTSDENLWVKSEAIAEFEETYLLEAECAADGSLRLIVDGKTIAEAQDDAFTEGQVGVFAQSFEKLPVEVAFDDLAITALEE